MSNETVKHSDNRSNEEGDWIARQFFSADDLKMSPEEYAALHAQNIGCFALHRYRYRDPALGAWVRRFGEIFDNAAQLEECRQRFLSPQELAEVRSLEAEEF
jgi:hypothetical protein